MSRSSENQSERSLRSRLISGSLWALAGKSLSACGSLIVFLLISSSLSNEETSAFVYCESVAVIGTIFATAGLHTVIVRALRLWKHGHHGSSLRSFGFRIVRIYLTTFGLVVICGATFTSWQEVAEVTRIRQHLGAVSLWILLLGSNQIVSEFLRGLENFRDAATMGGQNTGVLTLTILLGILIASRATGRMNLPLVFWAQSLAMTATLIWGLTRLTRTFHTQQVSAIAKTPDLALPMNVREIMTEGLPNLFTQISTLGITHLETLIVAQWCISSDIATYSGMKRLVQLTAAPLLMINSALPTFIADLAYQKKMTTLEALLRGSATVCFLPVLLVTSVFMVCPVLIINCIFPPGYAAGAAVLQFLSSGNLISVASGSCGLLLVMTGNQRYAMLSGMIAAIVFLLTASALTSSFGITGMAVAVAGSTVLRSAMSAILAKRAVGIWSVPTLSPKTLGHFFQLIRSVRQP